MVELYLALPLLHLSAVELGLVVIESGLSVVELNLAVVESYLSGVELGLAVPELGVVVVESGLVVVGTCQSVLELGVPVVVKIKRSENIQTFSLALLLLLFHRWNFRFLWLFGFVITAPSTQINDDAGVLILIVKFGLAGLVVYH